jgi:hypothetical protein
MPYRYWTPEEDQYLMDHRNDENARMIAKKLDRSYQSILFRCYKLGIDTPMNQKKRWTKSEDQYIIENYKTKTISQIAYKLNRTRGAVRTRVKSLGVRKTKVRHIKASSKQEYRKQFAKLRAQECIAQGVCYSCGNQSVSKMYCQECLDKMSTYNKEYYQKRRKLQQSGG